MATPLRWGTAGRSGARSFISMIDLSMILIMLFSMIIGNDDQAIEVFGAFILAYPEDARVADAEMGIQSCYYRSGRDMEEYLETNPDSPLAADIYWNKGQDAFAAQDYHTAAQAFERVTLDYPDSESGPGALFYLAESYYRAEDLDQALKASQA